MQLLTVHFSEDESSTRAFDNIGSFIGRCEFPDEVTIVLEITFFETFGLDPHGQSFVDSIDY